MAIEQFANKSASLLDGSITSGALTLDVDDASSFPTDPNFRILIEDELMLVTGVSSDTFTVTRGVEGTTPASHSDNLAVTHLLTAGALIQLIKDRGISKGLGDRRPITPGIYDEEFEGTVDTLPANWSFNVTPTGSDSWSLNSDWPSLLVVEGTGNGNAVLTRASFTPGSIDFGIWVHGYIGPHTISSKDWRITIADSTDANSLGIDLYIASNAIPSVRGIKVVSNAGDVAFGSGSDGQPMDLILTDFYFGFTRSSSNVWTAYYSTNGVAWNRLPTTESRSFTVDHILIQLPTQSGDMSMSGLDWIRYRTDLLFPRPG